MRISYLMLFLFMIIKWPSFRLVRTSFHPLVYVREMLYVYLLAFKYVQFESRYLEIPTIYLTFKFRTLKPLDCTTYRLLAPTLTAPLNLSKVPLGPLTSTIGIG